MYRRVRGEDDSIVSPRDTQKQVSREETFASDLHDDALIERELLSDWRFASLQTSANNRYGAHDHRELRDADFRTRSAQRIACLPIASVIGAGRRQGAAGTAAWTPSRRRPPDRHRPVPFRRGRAGADATGTVRGAATPNDGSQSTTPGSWP